MLKRGSEGNEVRKLQRKLIKLGYKCVVDGDYGPKTESLVKLFQKRNHMLVDGIAGPQTIQAMDKLINGSPKPRIVTIDTRQLEKIFTDVNPTVANKAVQLREIVKQKHNIDIIFPFGYRSIAEQNLLYAKGRTLPGNKVTNAKGGYSYHNYGLALDFAPLTDGKVNWKDIDKFKLVGEEAKKLGFTYGGDFTNLKDYGHIQMTFGLTIQDLLAGKTI